MIARTVHANQFTLPSVTMVINEAEGVLTLNYRFARLD